MSANLSPIKKQGLVEKFSDKYSIEPTKLLDILKATAFRQTDGSPPISNEQMAALLVIGDQYTLNPFTKEFYAYPDKKNAIVPVVSVDGWSRIVNDHPNSNGFQFKESETIETLPRAKPCPTWMEVIIYRKDREHPIIVREYLDEVYRPPHKAKAKDGTPYEVTGPWQTHTKRMLRHKVFIQGARMAYGFSGIYDEDEAQRIIEKDVTPVEENPRIQMPQPKQKEDWAKHPQRMKERIMSNQQPSDIDCSPAVAGEPPLSEGELNLIRTRLEQSALTNIDLEAKYGKKFNDLTQADFEPVMAWIADPMGAMNG